MLIRARARFVYAPADEGAGGAAAGAASGDASLIDDVIADEDKAKAAAAAAAAAGGGDKKPDAATKPDTATKPDKPAKPEFLADEFWDPDKNEPRLEALQKSQRDLRAQASKSSKAPAKPDDYKLPLPEGAPEGLVKADDPLVAEIRTAAHKAGVSQAQLDAIAGPFLAKAAELAKGAKTPEQLKAEQQEFLKAEVAKLGKTGEVQIKTIGTWGKGLVDKGVLSAEEFAEFRYAAGTAAGIRMLAKLRNLTSEQPVPIDVTVDGVQGSLEDYYALMRSAKPEDQKKASELLKTLARHGLLPDQPPPGIGIARR